MIFYFSGTGNTRWLARQLGEAMGERVIDIAKALDDDATYRLTAGERLGFCFPVHGWRPPFLVRDFVRGLRLADEQGPLRANGDHYVYVYATCGDDVGRTFEYFDEDLHAIGLHADSVFSTIMPESYLFPFIDAIDKPEVAAEKKERAKTAFAELLPAIVAREKGVRHVNESHWPRINSHLLGAFFLRYWVTDKPFGVAQDRCRRCGGCAKVCPVGNITCGKSNGQEENGKNGQGGLPTWLHNGRCTTCFTCYHHCPAHAITYGTRTAMGHRQYYFEK